MAGNYIKGLTDEEVQLLRGDKSQCTQSKLGKPRSKIACYQKMPRILHCYFIERYNDVPCSQLEADQLKKNSFLIWKQLYFEITVIDIKICMVPHNRF